MNLYQGQKGEYLFFIQVYSSHANLLHEIPKENTIIRPSTK